MNKITCPFCDDAFDLSRVKIQESEENVQFVSCPLCESAIPLDEAKRKKKKKKRKTHKMPSFLAQDRPKGQKDIYRALTRRAKNKREMQKRYGKDYKEVAARIAGRQGPPGKQHQGPPYTAPINQESVDENRLHNALQEAVVMYWGRGKSVDQIKRHLYEESGLTSRELMGILQDLGSMVSQYDSDVPLERVLGTLNETT